LLCFLLPSMKVVQKQGARGSLKWIQRAVNEGWPTLNEPILRQTGSAAPITWLSPLASDEFAEYRDGSFLKLIGHPGLEPDLREFWPARGPQWDALGKASQGDVLLVEANACCRDVFACNGGKSCVAVSNRDEAE
jgi:hypothetical protein